jgi:tryptophan synthase alpha chain
MSRLKDTFKNLKQSNKKAFSPFLMSGYPDNDTFLDLLKICSNVGVDFIEIGMPFSDPSADGPIIKKAGTLALENGITVKKTMELIKEFRKYDTKTPLIWMGYFNSIYRYGIENFIKDIKDVGIDALLVSDLPPEEANRLEVAKEHQIELIQLITPVTPKNRIPLILKNAGGFIYFVSITGITGTKEAEEEEIKKQVEYIQSQTDLPVVVGFGIKNPEKAKQINSFADGAIVGSALINEISKFLYKNGKNDKLKDKNELLKTIEQFLKSFTN